MQVLITYDVSTVSEGGKRRPRRVAKICLDHGQRVQNSVFECMVNPAQLVALRAHLLEVMDLESDSLRIYLLGTEWDQRVEHHGVKPSLDPEGPLIV